MARFCTPARSGSTSIDAAWAAGMVKCAVDAVCWSTSSWKRTTLLISKVVFRPAGVTSAGILLLVMVPMTICERSSVR
jgi:hypothetical protein